MREGEGNRRDAPRRARGGRLPSFIVSEPAPPALSGSGLRGKSKGGGGREETGGRILMFLAPPQLSSLFSLLFLKYLGEYHAPRMGGKRGGGEKWGGEKEEA